MKKALVTGSSRGIGRAIAEKLLKEGWDVTGISRSDCPFSHSNYTHRLIDLKNLEALPQVLKALAKETGAFDALVCNAGSGAFGHLEELSFDKIQEVIHLNFLSQAFLIKVWLPLMKRQKYGDIICIGSEAALKGKRKGSVYCASKFALRGFTQALREECAYDGVRVTLINPGMVNTPFFDKFNFRHGKEEDESIAPEDIAESVFMVLNARRGTVFDEINLSPQKHKVVFNH